MNDPESSIDQFRTIIESDADLTSRLLRIANSSFYGFPGRLDTISQAITLIGTEPLRGLVTATLVIEYFKSIPSDFADMACFWRHSLASAIAARTLAMSRRDHNPEQHFVAGLLHDIGRLLIFQKCPDRAAEVFVRYAESGRQLTLIEKDVLGFDHAEAGGALLEFWQFPASLVETVRRHHTPLKSFDFRIEASLVHIADIIALSMELGHSGERFPPPLQAQAWNRLGLAPSIVPQIVGEVDQQFNDALDLFLN